MVSNQSDARAASRRDVIAERMLALAYLAAALGWILARTLSSVG